jgi:hypothetical protein
MRLPAWPVVIALFLLPVALVAPISQASAATSPTAKPQSKPTARPTPRPTAAPGPALEPRALDILKASSAKLAAAKSMSFTALELYEQSSRQGHPLASATEYQVALVRPDKLRVFTLGDGPVRHYYYDGKTVTAFAPAENLVAVSPAPATVDTMLEAAYHLSGTYFPFTDVIVTDPYGDLAKGLKLAYYVGQSHVVMGTTTDEVAYVANGVFEQVWIGVDDKLPRLVRAVYLNDPAQLRHELAFSDWQLDPTVPADAFSAAEAANAKRIPFKHPYVPPTPSPKHT